MCNIEQMFHQILVNHDDRNYLRFLWWPDENYWKDPYGMRICMHLFGAASSPGCANFGLKQVATDNEEVFGYAVCFVCFVALCPKSTAMVIAGRSVHLTTLFPGQA